MLCRLRPLLTNSTYYWKKFQSVKIMSITMSPVIESDVNTTHSNKRPMEDDNDENAIKIQRTETETVPRIKRKNFVMMLSYLGKDYYGMQRNPGMKTIEEDLITALLKADLISTEHFENIRAISFQRAARTDKGVSAIRQIVSLKLPENPDKTIINQFLPDVIRVFGIKRVTKGFNSKNKCDARTYRYIIPTFAFASEDPNLLKIGEEVNEEERMKQVSTIDGKSYTEYRLSPESLDRLNSVLKLLEGTHNFHNFTSKTKPLDPRARRYIINFHCVETFISRDLEFAILEVKGQSFMLHQIRKMVAVVVAVMRNIVSEEIINEAFNLNKLEIPTAPSLGLCLCHVHYDNYSKRYGSDGLHETLDWKECEEDVTKFQREYILQHMVDTEVTDQTTLKWLAFLPEYSFSNREEEIFSENDEQQEVLNNHA